MIIKASTVQGVKCTLTIQKGYGVRDSNAKLVFLHGQCHALAHEISVLTGWKIVAFGIGVHAPSHMAVWCERLQAYIDIRGVMHEHELGVKWQDELPLETIAKNKIIGYMKPRFKLARYFANTLLRDIKKLYGLQPAKEINNA